MGRGVQGEQVLRTLCATILHYVCAAALHCMDAGSASGAIASLEKSCPVWHQPASWLHLMHHFMRADPRLQYVHASTRQVLIKIGQSSDSSMLP
jgi:hypothetical protein